MVKYTHGKLKTKGVYRDVFIEESTGNKLLSLTDVERKLNDYSRMHERYKKAKKRNESLTSRVSRLREELKVSKSREADNKAIEEVCEIFQSRIDLLSGEPSFSAAQSHLIRVKEELQEKGLWRIKS